MSLKVSTGVLYDGGVGGWSRDLKVIRELLKVIKQDIDFMSKSSVSKFLTWLYCAAQVPASLNQRGTVGNAILFKALLVFKASALHQGQTLFAVGYLGY